jgi:glutaredoxin
MRNVKVFVRQSHPGEPGIPVCQPCRLTKIMMDAMHIEYESINILVPENRQIWKDLQAAGHTQLPVVMVSFGGRRDGDVWTGFRPEKIRGLMQAPSTHKEI